MKAVELLEQLHAVPTFKKYGRVTKVVGLMIEAQGPESSIGDVCKIHVFSAHTGHQKILAEVVGFRDETVVLMPFTSLRDISIGCLVESTNKPLEIKIGPELIGKILDSMGNPLDGSILPKGLAVVDTEGEPPNPLTRPPIEEKLEVGVKAIDGMLTVGKGQRLGIFAGSGVGKSTLLGMIARNTTADLNVIALIGERGREVREFIERDLGPEGLKRSIIVAATSDHPALMRIKGAFTATAIAEYFRDRGKKVILMMDSVTRFAMAQREVGLAIGEPPATKGYTPSVFAMLPRLMERSGMSDKGSITAFYTVLVDGDDFNEPIADAVRGILDGHIVLSRSLAAKNHYPAIDILSSVSRLMSEIADEEHKKAASFARDLLATYKNSEDLINIGAYVKGSNKKVDLSIQYYDEITNYLKQGINEHSDFNESINKLKNMFK